MALSESDPSSFSNPENCYIKHLHLDLVVDFEKTILKGCVKFKVEKKSLAEKKLILDAKNLTIHNVFNGENGEALAYTVGPQVPSFGSKLEVTLPTSDEVCVQVVVEYETSPSATALQWLKPEQTAGKRHPYLFSQCQAIHARSMVPCQDTPAVKMTYTANITVPSELVALMSAVKQTCERCEGDNSRTRHQFEQNVPIPSYLIAIVVGALESREIGPRSKVWSEKEMVEESAYEFAETEKMLSAAEDLLGPYVWGVYDLLVLPPSFPYGGMENPCLTFVTPTLLAGDRSLASVVGHEIAHSWMGNLVTNKTGEHFWLNEGHTMFVERKIIRIMKGEKARDFDALQGWRDLADEVEELRCKCQLSFTSLVLDLDGIEPDDAYSTVPYEKGYNLLVYLEQKLGGSEVIDPFLKAYVERFKYQSITTDDWKEFLYFYFKDKHDLLNEVDWTTWLYKPGMPPVKPDYDYSLVEACEALCKRWRDALEQDLSSFTTHDMREMSPSQVTEFLRQLFERPALSKARLDKMDELYEFSTVRNSEIRFRWLALCVKAQQEEAIPKVLDFLNEQGRMKYVRPLYRHLYSWETARDIAVENYKLYKSAMHPLTASKLAKDMKLTDL